MKPVEPRYQVLDRPAPPTGRARIGIRAFACGARWPSPTPAPVCLWLPGRTGNLDASSAENPTDPRRLLAEAGAVVYAMDYRTHFVDVTCEEDLAACGSWNTAALLSDVRAAVRELNARHTGRPIVLIGHSMGAKLAYLFAASRPDPPIAGLVVLDGWLRNPPDLISDRERRAISSALDRWRAGDRVLTNQFAAPGTPGSTATVDDPTGRRRRLRQAYLREMLTSVGGVAGRMVGGAADATSIGMVLRHLSDGDRVWPAVVEIEARAMATGVRDHDLPRYDEFIADVRVPLLCVIAGDRGQDFTARARFTAGLLRHAPRTELVLDGCGHLDLVVGCHFGRRVSQPILAWLRDLPGLAAARR
ncbi:lysophospholipase [Microbispora cellulosiformans]|uniref:Lysophospholipase n=1 Tax=Microbispora cellulosiformans TaxID=2614688 RepID=A0A5J5KC67_9ACTN|nr:alpha/beta fold hydrolase [Microbispora cellulosiformans]KAA9381408.1 lysophospholipase [Microbispora cellulosiformans]